MVCMLEPMLLRECLDCMLMLLSCLLSLCTMDVSVCVCVCVCLCVCGVCVCVCASVCVCWCSVCVCERTNWRVASTVSESVSKPVSGGCAFVCVCVLVR